jgi:DNA replication protein DnaC
MRFLAADVPYGHPDFGRLLPCQCQVLLDAQIRFAACGLDQGEYAHMRFETYRPDPKYPKQIAALNFCRQRVADWATGGRRGVLFYSARTAVGVGKTHLAVAMLAEAVLQGKSIGFHSMPSFFNDLLDSYGKHTTAEIMTGALDPDVVLLDDLGAEMRTGDMVSRTYYDIIDQRLMHNKITLITTNLKLPEILTMLGPRVHSRLQALCPDSLVLDGEDHRIKK